MPAGPKRGHFSRSRSLEDFNKKFSSKILETTIENAKKPVRVLEIGCGEGRVLMQLCKLFPNIALHGINVKPWAAMKGQQSLKRTAMLYGTHTRTQLKTTKLPKIHFYNAKKLRFPDNHFDAIYSQVAIQYVDRKDELIEEIWRTLKPGGKAFLHIDTRHSITPDFLKNGRWVIKHKEKLVSLKKFFSAQRKRGFDITYKEIKERDKDNKWKARVQILIRKNTKRALKLGLEFDEISSFNVGYINKGREDWAKYWGYLSVYNLKKLP